MSIQSGYKVESNNTLKNTPQNPKNNGKNKITTKSDPKQKPPRYIVKIIAFTLISHINTKSFK